MGEKPENSFFKIRCIKMGDAILLMQAKLFPARRAE
jgi:hypothetical protein